MKFEVGDTVRLLHSGEEGVVTGFLGNDLVRVEVEGMDFPVFEDQLEYPYYKRFSEMKKAKKKRKPVAGADIPVENTGSVHSEERGMFLSLLPVYDTLEGETVVKNLKLYLVNETNATYTFHCKEYLQEALDFEVKSSIIPFKQFYLKDLSFDSLNDRPRLEFVFIPEVGTKEMAPSFAHTLKLKAKQVIKKLAEMNARQDAMFSYPLFIKYPLKAEQEKEQWDLPGTEPKVDYFRKKVTGFVTQPRYEVDLHAEKLVDDPRHLSPSDILLLQIAELQKALEAAIIHHQHTMVVIHGIGKGVLKEEVHAVLKQTPEVKRFVNQYDFRYGFGATEIFFEYS